MARAHLFRPITDNEGNLLYNATVTVREVDYSIPIGQSLYAGPSGTDTLANPFTATNGVIDFWLDVPQRMSILVQHQNVNDILVYLDAPPSPEEIVSSDSPLEIVNVPSTSGQVLLSTGTAGEAQWGNPPTGTGLTPVVVVSSQSFNSGFDPVGWSFVESGGAGHSYDPASIPPGTTYQYALKMAQTAASGSTVVTGPTFTLLESGRLSLWMRTSLSTNEAVTVKVSNASAVQTTLETITNTRDWGFYSYDLAAGTYTPIIGYTGTTPFVAGNHSFWFTGYVAQYGGNIPPHDHDGAGTNSVALGTSAAATGSNSTAVGATARASGSGATAFGYGAKADGTSAVAVGMNASAPTDFSMALGPTATGDATATAWVAMGYQASAGGQESVAVGTTAITDADFSTAVGSGATATGASSTAVGQNAQALGDNSVAIGQGAVVADAHNNSVALGANAATTSANQIMLGNNGAITTILGSLQNYGIASLGGPDSRVGFYGSAGNTVQSVGGSDDGNATLRSLVQALANLGLVQNNTVQQPGSFKNPTGVIDYFYHQDPRDGSLGVADFDFAPYEYHPLAFSSKNPYPGGPQWFVGNDHNGYKSFATGLGALKDMYSPSHTFNLGITTPSSTGGKICLALQHTGEEGSDAACGYIILDQAAGTVSLGVKNAGDDSDTYTVASGNSVAYSTLGINPFDGNAHTHVVATSGSSVMYVDTVSLKPVFFTDPTLNGVGTRIGVDFNQTTPQLNVVYFLPMSTFDGFKTTGALTNAPSGEAWWPVVSGSGASATVSAAGNLRLTSVTSGYSLAYVLKGANTSGMNIQTQWATGTTPSTSMGMVCRYVDPNNYFFINNSQITRVLNGTQTTLATLSSSFAAGDQMYVFCNGTTGNIQVQKNRVTVGAATDTNFLTSNRFGLGARGAATANFNYLWVYDNYSIGVTFK